MINYVLALNLLAAAAHPGLYTTPEDIAKGKLNIERFAWARAAARQIIGSADKWASMSDAELRALVPPPGSKYAYGFSGCPVCAANWPWWGGGGICSFDKPQIVTCPSCKREFPDADHPDEGAGWKRPSDGKMFYFVAAYNAYAVQQITRYILKDLARAYVFTEDRKYARAAAAVFDRLADTYPTDVSGSMDYPSNPPSGRLEQPWYQVARLLVLLCDYLDLLYDTPEFAAPSPSGADSIRRHIEESIIRDGGQYCYDQAVKGHMGLTNGQGDYVRGALAAGIMLGKQEWIDCAITGPHCIENFIQNTIDREGHYYESSLGYADHALAVLVNAAEMLYSFRSSDYPDGVDFYANPKFQKALSAGLTDLDCFGHSPRFGDWAPDLSIVTTDRLFSWYPYVYSEVLVARARDERSRRHWEGQREAVAFLGVEEMRSRPLVGDWLYWMVLHADPVSEPEVKPVMKQRPLLGGKGVAVLRSGKGPSGRAALLRFGPTLNHGQWDSLGLHYYALGRDLTYDLGYQLGSAHVQTSWARLTASHNLVVVNERNQMAVPCPGGDAQFYVDAAPVRAFEASDTSCYAAESVSDYRRTMALIDIPGGSSYLLDIFRVAGGEKHDLMWHFCGEMTSVEGVDLGPVQETGSLAGPDIDWGRRVGPAGDLIGCGDKPPYWNAPPGNGYGFLYDLRRGSPTAECRILWSAEPDHRREVSLRLLPQEDSELVTARAPGILPELPKADYAILRRKGDALKSTFVSVVEPVECESAITSVRRLDAGDAVCVVVESGAGTDYIFSAPAPVRATFDIKPGLMATFNGRFGFIRAQDARVRRGVLVEGTSLRLGDWVIAADAPSYLARVSSVTQSGTITLDRPVARQEPGTYAYLGRPDYSHTSTYRITNQSKDCTQLTFDADFVLARGRVRAAKSGEPGAIVTEVPLPTAVDAWGRPNGYMRGKVITNDCTGKTTTVIDVVKDQYTLLVKDPSVLPAGDSFTLYDVQPGDEVRVSTVVIR